MVPIKQDDRSSSYIDEKKGETSETSHTRVRERQHFRHSFRVMARNLKESDHLCETVCEDEFESDDPDAEAALHAGRLCLSEFTQSEQHEEQSDKKRHEAGWDVEEESSQECLYKTHTVLSVPRVHDIGVVEHHSKKCDGRRNEEGSASWLVVIGWRDFDMIANFPKGQGVIDTHHNNTEFHKKKWKVCGSSQPLAQSVGKLCFVDIQKCGWYKQDVG